MRKCKILHRYILREILLPFFLGFCVFTFVLLMDRFFDLVDLLIGKGLGFIFVSKIFLSSLPFIIALTIPMGVLVGIISGFGRLSGDSEILALRASGINPVILLPPVLLFSLFITLSMSLFNSWVLPFANYRSKELLYRASYKRPTLRIRERTFVHLYKGYTLWAGRIDHTRNELEDVRIYERKKGDIPRIITAKKGKMKVEEENLYLFLEDGEIHELEKSSPELYRRLHFTRFSIKIPLGPSYKTIKPARTKRELSVPELIKRLKGLKKRKVRWAYLVELNKRFSIPFAAIVFVFTGIPAGLMARRGGLGMGLSLSLLFFVIYYILLIGGEELGTREILHPGIGIWWPNLFLLLVSIPLLRKVIRS
ncbi:LPS export ABC transporter permease LptF [bacterium]|nr:MAG: LPS export ABC transporter permease LptF [bacterium]